MKYPVHKLACPIVIDADWNKSAWQDVDALELIHYMGEKPEHFPRTQAKLAYDQQFIYVSFRVEDQYVRAVAEKHQDPVSKDSCVEFFFAPRADLDTGYFNVEVNCSGFMLLHFQIVPRKNPITIDSAILDRIEIAHSMPKGVDPEISEPTTWTVEYRLPFDFLTQYCPTAKLPEPGVSWPANFYKCADDCSHPHWLTWSPVNNPFPDFHLPAYFGEIIFK